MRRIVSSLALAFLLALPVASQDTTSSDDTAATPGATADASVPDPGLSVSGPLSVVTVNAWSGLEADGFFSRGSYEEPAAREFRLRRLADGIAALEPDIVTLGEANPVDGMAASFSEALGMSAVSHMAEGGVRIGPVGLPTNLREGDIILAREAALPSFAARRTLAGGYVGRTVSLQTGETTQVLGVELVVEGRSVYVFHTRWFASPFATRDDMVELIEAYGDGELASEELIDRMDRAVRGKERRLEEARRTIVTINEVAGDAPVILTGTLNALPGSEEIAMLEEAGFVDAFAWARGSTTAAGVSAGATWDPGRNTHITRHGLGPWEDEAAARIDYVFVRGAGVEVAEARVVLSEATYGVFPSSHFGVLARITIPQGGTP
ncbi:MAG: endonuclease/exonuclease/phosphatase family protein [Spirochaetia bacterium]